MWKIKKEYHYYSNTHNAKKDRYMNKGDLISVLDGEATNTNYLYSLLYFRAKRRYEPDCCVKPNCPHLLFATKEEATEAMNKIGNIEGTYYLFHGEYSRPTLCVQFHHSWQ